MITSTANAQVKQVVLWQSKAKVRHEDGVFVVEGLRLVREVPAGLVRKAYASEGFLKTAEGAELAEKLQAEVVSDHVFQHMSDTKAPQGILAVVNEPVYTLEMLEQDRPVVVLETLQDPGNLGTIFRTAEAAGAGGILMNRETADPLQPKVVRSTMGAIFRLPFYISTDLKADLGRLKEAGFRTYAAHLSGEKYYHELDYPLRTAFLIGNEGNGLSEMLTNEADVKLKIPMEGKTESLNAAVAASVLLYESFRQRLLK